MPSVKCDIDADLVTTALAEAKAGVAGIKDYVDAQQSYLVLRLREHAISWLVKTRSATRRIGSPPDMLVRQARRHAQQEFAGLGKHPPPAPAADVSPGWTWSELRARYEEHIRQPRIKHGRAREPSERTHDDVQLSFSRTALEAWSERRINTLRPTDLTQAILEIQSAVSHRQALKSFAYVKSALSFALSNHPTECGLSPDSPWWMAIKAPAVQQNDVLRLLERQTHEKVTVLSVDQLGKVLAIHEDYCRGRVGRHRISPAVRWAMWWDVLTACRRGAATMINRDAVIWSDERGEPGWGLAWWPASLMKARLDHWLPIPPLGLHILQSVQRDWRAAVNKEHGHQNETAWVFASTRRIGRDPANRDVVMAPDAIANHLSNMRGRRGHHRDHLKGIPHFSPHDLRDSAATYLLDRHDLPPGAASAMLGHIIKGDRDPRHERMSPTTRQFYDFSQRIPLKTLAMKAWSEALLDAFKRAGGTYPD